jgi:hypothetical protein
MSPDSRVLWATVFLFGCGGAAHDPFHSPSTDAVFSNGESLNGESLNGESLNGESLNGSSFGSSLVSVSFAGASLRRGDSLTSTWLSGTVFYGTDPYESVESGWDFAGARFQGTTDTGAQMPLYIAGIRQEQWPNDDVWEYWVSFYDGESWNPLCVNSQGYWVPAIPVNGRWNHARGVPGGGAKIADPSSFTFACKGMGAIAKCVYPIGYKPWKTVNGVSLDRAHQACVRLLRGDFCGLGVPYTRNGNRVDIYDGIGIQQDTQPLWLFEAEWDQNGARCFNPLNRSHSFVPCFNVRALSVCGTPLDYQLGALLMDKTPLPILQ